MASRLLRGVIRRSIALIVPSYVPFFSVNNDRPGTRSWERLCFLSRRNQEAYSRWAVELRQARYFVVVAEMENVSRAALKLPVSQPASVCERSVRRPSLGSSPLPSRATTKLSASI